MSETVLILYFFNLLSLKNKKVLIKFWPVWTFVVLYTTLMVVKSELVYFIEIDNYLYWYFNLSLNNFTDVIFTTIITFFILYREWQQLSFLQRIFWVSTINFIIIAVVFGYKVILNYRFEVIAANPSVYGIGLMDRILYDFNYFVMTIMLFFAFFLTKKVIRPSFVRERRPNTRTLIYLVGISFLSVWILVYLAKNVGVPFYLSKNAINAVIVSVIIINSLVWLIYKEQELHYQEVTQIEIEKILFESKVKEFERIQQQTKEMEKFRHDLKNQSITLFSLLKNQEIQLAQEMIENNLETIDSFDTFYTNHLFMNAFLNMKNKEAQSKGIALVIKVFLPEKLTISPDILGVVIGNLLDNAFAAVSRSQFEEKRVDCIIKFLDNNLLIEVKNHFDVLELEQRASRKELGYGIKNIQRTVENHNGIYKRWIEDETFYTSILFLGV